MESKSLSMPSGTKNQKTKLIDTAFQLVITVQGEEFSMFSILGFPPFIGAYNLKGSCTFWPSELSVRSVRTMLAHSREAESRPWNEKTRKRAKDVRKRRPPVLGLGQQMRPDE